MPNIKQINTGWALTARIEAIQQRIIEEQQLWGPCLDLRTAEKPTVWHSYQIHDFPKAIPSWDGSMLNYEETVQTAVEEQTGLKPVQWRQSKKTDANSPTTILIISFDQPLKSSFKLLGQGTFSLPLTHTKKIEQCQNCWAFHAPNFCRGTQCCGNCGSVEYQEDTCTQRPRCANCYGPHNASYEHCFAQPKKAKNGLRALSKTGAHAVSSPRARILETVMSTINVVKYYFHANRAPASEARMRLLVALAYQTARDKQLYPKAVLIRSEVHSTTTINGQRQKDPKGDHVTFSYKTQDHLGRESHVACYGYVKDPTTLAFREATHATEKADATLEWNKRPVWPKDEDLWEAPDVGYSQMPESE